MEPLNLVALLTALGGAIAYLMRRLDARNARGRLKADMELLEKAKENTEAHQYLTELVTAEAKALRPDVLPERDRQVRRARRLLTWGVVGFLVAVLVPAIIESAAYAAVWTYDFSLARYNPPRRTTFGMYLSSVSDTVFMLSTAAIAFGVFNLLWLIMNEQLKKLSGIKWLLGFLIGGVAILAILVFGWRFALEPLYQTVIRSRGWEPVGVSS